jgi:hypothetical protein
MLASHYFLHELKHDPRVQQAKLSHFEINRLWELELSMLVFKAIEQNCSLAEAAVFVHTSRPEMANTVMGMIFQGQQTEEEEEERVGRLQEKMLLLLEDSQLQLAVEDCERTLWIQQEEQFFTWLQSCYTSSLGSAIFTSLTQLIPDIDPDDLTFDIDGDQIWISEVTPGGIGIISRLAEMLELRAHDFELQMFDTLQYCERQQLAVRLDMIANLIAGNDSQLFDVFTHLRRDNTLMEQETHLEALKKVLEQHGIAVTRELMVALRTKFLRPNSDKDTDELIAELVHFWHEQENRLECKIEIRVIATAALNDKHLRSHIESVLKRISGTETVGESQIFNILQSLLWLSCSDSCPDCIEKTSYYQEMIKPSRALILSILEMETQMISFGQTDWDKLIRDMLSTQYSVRISCTQEQLPDCQLKLMDLLISPIEIGYQFFYPVIERAIQTGNMWTISMGIREFVHA